LALRWVTVVGGVARVVGDHAGRWLRVARVRGRGCRWVWPAWFWQSRSSHGRTFVVHSLNRLSIRRVAVRRGRRLRVGGRRRAAVYQVRGHVISKGSQAHHDGSESHFALFTYLCRDPESRASMTALQSE
jgi:hypothetical protein